MKATANIPQYTAEQFASMTDEQYIAHCKRKFVVKLPSGYDCNMHYETTNLEKATKYSECGAMERLGQLWKTRRVKGEMLLIVD